MARSHLFSALALCFAALSTACLDERTYVDPASNAVEGDAWNLGGTGSAALRGDVGDITEIDNMSTDMYVVKDQRTVELSGTVPHQARAGSSVWLDIRIVNAQLLRLGQELRQEGTVDTLNVDDADGPQLDVYVCPNGEGVSGNADDIVVTRTGPQAFTFVAKSTNVEQNLNVDLDLAMNDVAADQ